MTSEAFIFVSDDTKHDSHTVQHFDGIMMKHLNEQHTTPFQKVIFFSDGVPAQYKNKTAFADLSCTEEDFGDSAERHFFGTRHGKGHCDRELGTLKKAVKMQGTQNLLDKKIILITGGGFSLCQQRTSPETE